VRVDARGHRSADVYSLGLVFLEMLKVVLPHPPEVSNDFVSSPWRSRRKILNYMPEGFEDVTQIIDNMLKMEQSERPTAERVWSTLATAGFCGSCCEPSSVSARDDRYYPAEKVDIKIIFGLEDVLMP